MSSWVGCVDGLVGDGCGMTDCCEGDFGSVDCVVVQGVVMWWGWGGGVVEIRL